MRTGGTARAFASHAGRVALRSRVGLAVLAFVFVVATPAARADEADDVRSEMLSGGPGRWRTVFRRIEANPPLLARALGPIFRDRGDRVRPLSAWAAAALADRAGRRNQEPHLAEEILRRASQDAEYVAEVRANLDADGQGWDSLVFAARRRLFDTATDPSDRSAAAFFLRFQPTKQNARDLVAAWENAPRQVADAAGESLRWLLVTRFATPADARAFFDRHERSSFVDWLRAASAAKDGADWPLRVRMVEEARKNLDRLSTPGDLQPYLSEETTPYVEVRRAAAKRAAQIEAPSDAWLPLLVQVVQAEEDQETLLGLLDVAKRVRMTDRAKAQGLSSAILARLSEGGGSRPLAQALVNLLGSVADPATAAAAFEAMEPGADAEMLDALLSLVGSVGGSEAVLLRFHAARATATDAASVRLRAKALDALAQGAGRAADPEVAGRYLRAVLRRDDALDQEEAGLPRETSPEGRRAAVLGLQAFPGAATAARLADVARVEAEESSGRVDDAALARLALGVLGRLASGGDVEAASAVVTLAGDDALRAVRVDALKALARLPAESSDALRERAQDAARAALAPSSPTEVRLAAAEASESLGDPRALAGLLALALEQLRETPGSVGPVRPLLEGLVRRLARAGPESDARVAATLRLLAAAGALDAALSAAASAAEEGQGRLALQVARAELMQARALRATVPEERVRSRQDAERIVRTALAAVPVGAPERTGAAWRAALALRRSLLDALLADDGLLAPEDRKHAHLARVEVAAAAGDPADVEAALDVARRARSLDLTPEDLVSLDQNVAALRRLAPP